MERRAYGSFNAGIWGKRYWGKYNEPRQFHIAVNEMSDVEKHQDVSLALRESVGIQSSLSDGIRVNFV